MVSDHLDETVITVLYLLVNSQVSRSIREHRITLATQHTPNKIEAHASLHGLDALPCVDQRIIARPSRRADGRLAGFNIGAYAAQAWNVDPVSCLISCY
jgi:hypothetical protein